VWLEFTPFSYIEKIKYYPDSESASLTVIATLVGKGEFKLSASFADRCVGSASVYSGGGTVTLNLPLSEKHLWQVGEGNLYNLELSFGEDKVKSYFGLRKIRIDGRRVLINEKCVFQRLVLDQGFYPDGIYTAPSDEELRLDIERSLAMGFNGARLHEKIFEERFLYYADKLGYIVWEEYPNLGLNPSYLDSIYPMLPEWCEAIERDFNHPSIVGWAPFNETFSFGIPTNICHKEGCKSNHYPHHHIGSR
jgi:beta-galactosidase/beta-glucuronidase